jgi:hypothetical protein
MWHGMCTDPILRCFNNLEGLSYRDLIGSVVPKISSWLIV